MAFQIKDFVSICAAMINRAKATQSKLTDFTVGSVARTMIEAPAIEIDELYQQMWNGLKESIPVAIYKSFEFDALAAVSSVGTVRVTIASSSDEVMIASGDRFIADDGAGTEFSVVSDAVISAGNTYGDVKVVALTAGAAGNIPIGTSFTVSPKPDGFVSAVSISGFVIGADAETLAQRQARFVKYVKTLNRGTVSALKYGAGLAAVRDSAGVTTESVKSVVITEPWLSDPLQPVALVNCYIHNGVDGASGSLVSEVSKVIDGYVAADGTIVAGWKAAGVKVAVYAAAEVSVAVTATVSVDGGYIASDVIGEVTDVVANYFSDLGIGENVILAELISAVMAVDGVLNFRLAAPADDVAVAAIQKAAAGTLTITEA
jgi:uncharacterized phage protein gp47/JayE